MPRTAISAIFAKRKDIFQVIAQIVILPAIMAAAAINQTTTEPVVIHLMDVAEVEVALMVPQGEATHRHLLLHQAMEVIVTILMVAHLPIVAVRAAAVVVVMVALHIEEVALALHPLMVVEAAALTVEMITVLTTLLLLLLMGAATVEAVVMAQLMEEVVENPILLILVVAMIAELHQHLQAFLHQTMAVIIQVHVALSHHLLNQVVATMVAAVAAAVMVVAPIMDMDQAIVEGLEDMTPNVK